VLPTFVSDVLKQHHTRQVEGHLKVGTKWHEHDLVFCNIYGGYLDPSHLRQQFDKLLRDAGLPDVRFHDLRHSAATILLSMGVPAKVIQEILGHSQISMTMDIYSHVLPVMQQEAMSKMHDVFKHDLLVDGEGDHTSGHEKSQ